MADVKQGPKKVTEEQVTDFVLMQQNVQDENQANAVITEYPILDFDENALAKLSCGIKETIRQSDLHPAGGKGYLFIKRFFDIVVSFVGLVILCIPMAIVALCIFIEDGHFPIFAQTRLTEDGKPFRMYKFRSMCVDAEEKFQEVQAQNEAEGAAFKIKDDPRVTKIGRFIRRTSIDELPQLWNVLKGDMSLIGPRPPLPREVVMYTPREMDRLQIKGGLGTLAQAKGRSHLSFDQWVDYDLDYIQNRSFKMDCKIFFSIIGAVLRKEGAE